MHFTLELSQIQFAIKKILIDQLSQIVVLLSIYVVIFRRTSKLCSCTCFKTRTEVGAETGLASSTYHRLSTRRNQSVQQHSALRLDMAWPCASQHFLLRSDPNGWRLFRLSILKRAQGWQKRPLQERKVSGTGSFGSGWWTRWRCDKSRDQSRDTIWRDMTRQDLARFIKIH
jgi:hypothetical protein